MPAYLDGKRATGRAARVITYKGEKYNGMADAMDRRITDPEVQRTAEGLLTLLGSPVRRSRACESLR